MTAPLLANPVHVTLPGVIIAIVFVIAIGGTLWWMLRLPQTTPQTLRVAKAVRQAKRLTRILVPVHGGILSERILALAALIASRRGATLEVLYVERLSPLLPPDASLPRADRLAQETLERAAQIAQRFGIKPECRAIRARDPGWAIVREAEETGVDLIMMGAGARPRPFMSSLGPVASYVFRYAPCEVILDRAAPAGHGTVVLEPVAAPAATGAGASAER